MPGAGKSWTTWLPGPCMIPCEFLGRSSEFFWSIWILCAEIFRIPAKDPCTKLFWFSSRYCVRSCEFFVSSFKSLGRDPIRFQTRFFHWDLAQRSCGFLDSPWQGPCSENLWVPFKDPSCRDLVNYWEEYVYKDTVHSPKQDACKDILLNAWNSPYAKFISCSLTWTVNICEPYHYCDV